MVPIRDPLLASTSAGHNLRAALARRMAISLGGRVAPQAGPGGYMPRVGGAARKGYSSLAGVLAGRGIRRDDPSDVLEGDRAIGDQGILLPGVHPDDLTPADRDALLDLIRGGLEGDQSGLIDLLHGRSGGGGHNMIARPPRRRLAL